MSAGGGPLHAPFARRALALLCTPPIWRALRPAPGGFCGTVVPAAPDMRGGLAPSSALLPCMGAPREHGFAMLGTRVTFLRKESHQRFARDLLVLDFEEVLTSSTRGRTPLDSPTFCPSGIGCGNLNSQASSKPILPSHGLKVESVPLTKPEEKTRPICPPTQSGKSVFCCGRR